MPRLISLVAAVVLLAITAPGLAQPQERDKGTTFTATVTDGAPTAQPQRQWQVNGTITAPEPAAKSFDWALAISIVVPIVLALLTIRGAYRNSVKTEEAKYWNNVRTEEWKARLAFVNDQLEHLYGPLYSMANASNAAWAEFFKKVRPNRSSFFGDGQPPTKAELIQWMAWMTLVFKPLNEAMVKAIVDHSHLIEGEEMPRSFLELIAHTEGYRVTIGNWAKMDDSEIGDWKKQDVSQYVSVLNFPNNLKKDVTDKFLELKKRQVELLKQSAAQLAGQRASEAEPKTAKPWPAPPTRSGSRSRPDSQGTPASAPH